MKTPTYNKLILGALCSLFIIYNYILYTKDTTYNKTTSLSEEAIMGEDIWQSNNCTACHQLYGLGGYLGPDLTNIISNNKKGAEYAKVMIQSGIKSMPQFDFSEMELEAIISFLDHVDQTGYYPNQNAIFNNNGWVEIEYK